MALTLINSFSLSVFILDIVISSLLVYKLTQRVRETNLTSVKALLTFYIIDLIAVLVELPFFLLNFDDPSGFYLDPDNFFIFLFIGLGLLSGIMFLSFVYYFAEDRLSISGMTFIVVLVTSYLMYIALLIFGNAENLYIPNTPFSLEFIPAVFFTYVVIISLTRLIKIRGISRDEYQKRQITLMLIAIIFYYIFTSVFITVSEQGEDVLPATLVYFLRHPAARFSVVIGDFILYSAYAKSRMAFLQYQTMEKLLVISNDGLPLYTYDFSANGRGTAEDALLSSGLIAISALLSEAIKVSEIKMIQFKEKQIMVSHEKNFGVFLITDRPTIFLWNALDAFASNFNKAHNMDTKSMLDISKTKQFRQSEIITMAAFGLSP